jgi:uncharacterized protein (TIGR02996 family)
VTHDERGLIDTIRDDPDDDSARLVYADWLEEHGQSDRAEFMRLQLARAAGTATAEDRQREKKLLAAHFNEWLGPVADRRVEFSRGVPLLTWRSLDEFAKGTTGLKKPGAPALIDVELDLDHYSAPESEIIKLVGTSRFSVLSSLSLNIYGDLTSATARAIASSRHAGNLRELHLHFGDFSGGGAAALASRRLRRLRILSFRSGVLGADEVAAVVNSRTLENLTELWFTCAVRSEPEIEAIAGGTGLPKLKTLGLVGNRIRNGRLRLLLKSPLMGRLEELSLHVNSIGDGGAKALAEGAALAGLKRLDFSHNAIGDEGAEALLDSPHLAGLEKLNVEFNSNVSAEIQQRVRQRFGPYREER